MASKRTRRAPPESAGPPATSRARADGVGREPAPAGACGLSTRDEIVALCLATGRTLADAARESGYGRRTVYDVVRRPAVVARAAELRREILAETASRLLGHAPEAVDVMVELMRDTSGDVAPAVRLWAAQAVLSQTLKVAEASELRGELESLRAQLAEIQGEGRR